MNLRGRIILILYIVSITVSLFIFASYMNGVHLDAENVAYTNSVISDDGDIFYAPNINGQGLIFMMDGNGNVSHVFSSLSAGETRISGLSAATPTDEAVLYALLSSSELAEDDGTGSSSTQTVYKIVSLDRKLRILMQTTEFSLPEDEMPDDFSAEMTGLFITTVSLDGMSVNVYSIRREELRENEDEAGKIMPENVRSRSAQDGRFFVQAKYAFGELEVRTDMDAPTGSFAEDERITDAVSVMRLGAEHYLVLYRMYILRYLTLLIIWFIVLAFLIKLLTDRNRLVYSLAIAEAVLAVVTGGGLIAVSAQARNARETEHMRFAFLSLESLSDQAGVMDYVDYSAGNFYETDRYHSIQKTMSDFVMRGGNRSIFYDVFVVKLADGVVMAGASGRNLEDSSYLYGTELDELTKDLYRGSRYASESLTIDGQSYSAVGLTDTSRVTDYALVGIINDSTVDAGVWADNRGIFILFALLFAGGSALLAGAWYLQSRDLFRFEEALKDTAMGRSLKERPAVVGRDLKEMWDSLTEVRKLVDTVNYSKFRILEAYYRFAPKNIEQVLDKVSIMEVKSGDSRDLSGTVAMIVLNDRRVTRSATAMEDVLGRIGEYQKRHDSIMTSMSPDLRDLELLFLDNEKDTVGFLTSVICDHIQSPDLPPLSATMLYDTCTFGVIGSGDEAHTWHSSVHQELLYQYGVLFSKLGLGLVISETVKIRENVTDPLRYIGYVYVEGESDPVRFYEVLDTCPAKERVSRINAAKALSEALSLFYEKDFYLARSRFSDILRITPDDELVKWYIFESDSYLNGKADDASFGSLHL